MAPKIKSIKTGYAKDHKEAVAFAKGILGVLQNLPSELQSTIPADLMEKTAALLNVLYLCLTSETDDMELNIRGFEKEQS